jgi:PIN domain nuclease of toxin-antitoxin system
LWFVLNDPSLSAAARAIVSDPQNDVLISPATWWEIAIKVSIGKYQLPGPFADFLDDQIARNDLMMLPISVRHTAVVASLPFPRAGTGRPGRRGYAA